MEAFPLRRSRLRSRAHQDADRRDETMETYLVLLLLFAVVIATLLHLRAFPLTGSEGARNGGRGPKGRQRGQETGRGFWKDE